MKQCPPVDAFISSDRLTEEQHLFPMDLYLCGECGHAQLLDVVSPKLLFGSYIYTTSSSPGLVEYFQKYAASVCSQLNLSPGSLAIDIGSNDGTLLAFFRKNGLRVLGIDPAAEISANATARGIETLPEFFTSEVAKKVRSEKGAADLITANNVFAHSDFLGDMADGIRHLLSPSGVFVFDVSYLLDIVDKTIFDVIYHEHLSYHSIKPLQIFFKRHGLHLFRVERTTSKGGSIRCFVQLQNGSREEDPFIKELLQLEENYGLYRHSTFQKLSERIEIAKVQLQSILSSNRFNGKTIAGYGASATATVLIYQFDLGNFLRFIVDDNPVRQNRYSPGHHIPIVSSQALLDQQPEAVIILAWHYADMIMERNKSYQQNGGSFLIPLPHLIIV